ncbi:PRC-barrel domain-containing protein [Oricola sp.]|uniref:PRC-barrel domain-containing protein n=1 Tax=Oricola sp. TaxID=1979950 RepID=UPI003BACEE49
MTSNTKTTMPASAKRTAFGAVIAAISLLAGLSIAASPAAQAFDLNADRTTDRIAYMTAYSDPMPERFGMMLREDFAPQPEFDFEGEHESNDAWLGMSVVSEEGVYLGYVTDAYIDEDGTLDELLLEPAGDGVLHDAVYVPARFAKLGANAVQLTLTVNAMATLEIADEYALLAE